MSVKYEHTISNPSEIGKPKFERFLDMLTHDNIEIVKRPGYRELTTKVFPMLRTKYRSIKLPTTLGQLEDKFLDRVLWPKSIYKYSSFKTQIEPFTKVDDAEVNYEHLIAEMRTCFKPSTSESVNLDTIRNKRALAKGAGLPNMGKKKESLDWAREYNRFLETDPRMSRCYSVVPTYRTKESKEPDIKVRLIWMVPVNQWLMESAAFDDAIDRTMAACQELNSEIQNLYIDPRSQLKLWMNHFKSKVVQWVYMDSSQYDATVHASEIVHAVHYFAPKYQHKELLAAVISKSDIVMPDGVVSRSGGMPSGTKLTNIGDSWTNIGDGLECLDSLGLRRYLVCALVNGDDITYGFATKLSSGNLEKWSKLTRRTLNADKCISSEQALWNSKWYCDGNITTRPIFRALNSLLFKEREGDPITVSAVYVAVARHSIMLDIEEHPMFEDLARELAKYEEVTWEQAKEDPRFQEALEKYVSTHDYLENKDAKEFSEQIGNSRYAKEFAR